MDNQPRNPFLNVFQGANCNFLPPRTRIFVIMFVYIFVLTIAIRIWSAVIDSGNLVLLTFASIISFVLVMLVFFHCCFSSRGQGVVPIPPHDPHEFEGQEFAQMIHRAILEALNERNNAYAAGAAVLTQAHLQPRTREMVEYTLDQLKTYDYSVHEQIILHEQTETPTVVVTDEEGGGQCTICLEEYHAGDRCTELRCGHVYHRPCLIDWMMRRNKCPLCSDSVHILSIPSPSSAVIARRGDDPTASNDDVIELELQRQGNAGVDLV